MPGILRSKRLRAVSEQRTRNECQKTARKMWRVKERGGKEENFPSPPLSFLALIPFFAQRRPKVQFLVIPRSLFVPKPHWNACYAGYGPDGRLISHVNIQGTMQAKVLLALRSQLRERLIRLDKTNQKNLETIETSLFALVLDERSPVTETEVTVTVLCSVLTRPRYCGIAALFREMPHYN